MRRLERGKGVSALSAGGFPFVMQLQQRRHWCWAATTVSIVKHYEPTTGWLQCLLVDDQFQTQTCCEQNSTEDCNRDWRLDRALQAVDHFARLEAGPAPLRPSVAVEVDAARPMAARIAWSGGGAHFAVINGYAEIFVADFPFFEKWLTVQDSEYGPSVVSYDSFRTAYQGSGTWTHTFYTR